MLINYRERQRRMRGVDEDVWSTAEATPDDVGLREVYDQIPRAPIRLLCCPLHKEVNHGGILRAAEAFRIERVYFSPEPDKAIDGSGHRGTKRWQPYEWMPIDASMTLARTDGYRVVSVSLSNRTVDIDQIQWSFPMALVLGNELNGIPEEVERRCDDSVAIPLFGLVQSLNVAVAAAVALREAVAAYRSKDPSFEPARNASRRLLGLEPKIYSPGV